MIGGGELLLILCVVLLLFGGKKLPELARSLGIGIKEFKKACHGLDEEVSTIDVSKTKDLPTKEPPKQEPS